MKRVVLITLLLLVSLCGIAVAEELAVIVNKENSNTIDRSVINRIYLGSLTRWPAGGHIQTFELHESMKENQDFSKKVLGRSQQSLRDHWATLVFTGKAAPPRQLSSEDEMVRAVSANKNAIGYVRASKVNNDVRVVLKVQ